MSEALVEPSCTPSTVQETSWDLCRIDQSKTEVDICSNTIRSYHRQGLPLYKRGKATFFSKTELNGFIRRGKIIYREGA